LTEGLVRIREALANDPDGPVDLQDKALKSGALLAFKQGDPATARELTERLTAVADESEDEDILAEALNLMGIVLTGEGRFDEARRALERGLALNERRGNDARKQSCLHNLGLISLGEREYDRAVEELTAALQLSRGHERPASNDVIDRAFALIGLGRWAEARVDAQEGIHVAQRIQWRENVAYGLVALAAVAVAENELERAARFLGQAKRLAEELHLDFTGYAEQARVGAHEALRSLPHEQVDSLLAEGRAWSLDEAVAAAVEQQAP
jgi:tetratricopeptide (TPR) repeat protein